MWFLRLLPIGVTLLFILFQCVDVTVVKRDNLTIKINFNLLAIVLYDDKKKRIRLKNLRKYMFLTQAGIKSLKYIVSKSRITVYSPTSYTDAFNGVGVGFLSATMLIPYLAANAHSFRYFDRYHGAAHLDISLRISYICAFISALLFLYYSVRIKIRRTLKNVRY